MKHDFAQKSAERVIEARLSRHDCLLTQAIIKLHRDAPTSLNPANHAWARAAMTSHSKRKHLSHLTITVALETKYFCLRERIMIGGRRRQERGWPDAHLMHHFNHVTYLQLRLTKGELFSRCSESPDWHLKHFTRLWTTCTSWRSWPGFDKVKKVSTLSLWPRSSSPFTAVTHRVMLTSNKLLVHAMVLREKCC